ncbi:hypothetical protein [Paraburkholderia phenoliruptrix]|uniref:Uncharacterized protein n=1 Tax=Paraburkholderia phenoliruptrix BR3459a TaxID=1229205 RepID=K0E0L0_9BURK|nr:hypothetical protein [Paraburkholderia phenoliruptrix]AFT90287.1 hypothetical protein BUPH_08376 [Paraburkholderia phenoliruptrix BR3459a]
MANAYARRIMLPRYVETVTCGEGDPSATRVDLPNGKRYFARPMYVEGETNSADGVHTWRGTLNISSLASMSIVAILIECLQSK